LIGIAAPFLGRYREFSMCVNQIKCPVDSVLNWYYGVLTTNFFNMMANYILQNEKYKWLWILEDSFVFHPDLLSELLKHDADVVVPLTLHSEYPYRPRIYEDAAGEYLDTDSEWLTGQRGLIPLTGKTARSTGMLIKRHVFEHLDEPWFTHGVNRPGILGGDIWFCQKLHEHGYGLYMDLDNSMGSVTHVGVRARRNEDGTYATAVNVTLY
jgi:hypothetical protein